MYAIRHVKENRLLCLGCTLKNFDDAPEVLYTLMGSTSIWFADTREEAEKVVEEGFHYDNPWDNAEDQPYHEYQISDLEVVAVEMAVFPKEVVEVFSLKPVVNRRPVAVNN